MAPSAGVDERRSWIEPGEPGMQGMLNELTLMLIRLAMVWASAWF